MKKLFPLLLFPLMFSAQTHRFIYEYQMKPDSTATSMRTNNMILDINPDDVKFYEYAYAENDSLNKVRNYRNTIWNDTPALKRTKNSDKNTNYSLMDEFYSFETEDPITWKLHNDTKTEGSYTLQKATANFGGRSWIAWFSKDIAVNEGPYKFRGLPGLVFSVEDSKMQHVFKLIKSYKLEKTYDTSEFLESFAFKKALPVNEKVIMRKKLEFFNNPLKDFAENFKNSNGEGTFSVMGTQVKSMDQFKELNKRVQDMMRRENNPIEIDKAPRYPSN